MKHIKRKRETVAEETKWKREEENTQLTTRFKLCYSFLNCDNSQILRSRQKVTYTKADEAEQKRPAK